jgi:hypothetical protein
MARTEDKKAFCALEFASTESIVMVQQRFWTSTKQNHLWTKQFVIGTRNSSRVGAYVLWNEQACWGHRPRLLRMCNQYHFTQRHLCRMCQSLDWGICSSARCVDFWVLLTKVSRTRSTVSANGLGRPVHFTAHWQPLCWNFLYHSWIILSIGGSVWYLAWNSVAPSQLTQFWQIPRHRKLSYPLSLPCFVTTAPSSETCKYTMVPVTQTNLEEFCTYWYAPFCCVSLGCYATEFGSSEGTYELLCMCCCLEFRYLETTVTNQN